MRFSRCILLALAAMAAGCMPENHESYRKSWERVELPGFSMLMPPGKVVETSTEPSVGKHQRQISRWFIDEWVNDISVNGSVMAMWSNEAASFEVWKRDYLPIMLAALDSELPGSKVLKEVFLDEDRWIFVYGTDRVPIAMATVHCDEHFSVQIMYLHYHDVARQIADVRELMDSVNCSVRTENQTVTRAATRLPEKFGLAKAIGPQQYRSLDGESLSLNFSAGNVLDDKKVYRLLIAQIASTDEVKVKDSDMEVVPIPKILHDEPTMLLRITYSTDKSRLYVGTLYCAYVGLSLVSVWAAPEVSDNLAIQRLSQIGCPNTPSTPSPSFESLVEAACQAGDSAACDLKTAPAGS